MNNALVTAGSRDFSLMLKERGTFLKQIASKSIDPEKLMKSVIKAIDGNYELQKCSAKSVLRSVMISAELGLEINNPKAEGYLIPYKGECTFIPGYMGLVTLAIRSGMVRNIVPRCVCDGDTFEVLYGTEDSIIHKPNLDIDRKASSVRYVYAVATMMDGSRQFEVMNRSQVETIRQKSPGKNSEGWVQHWDEMALKTVVRRLCKRIPKSDIITKAIQHEDAVEYGNASPLWEFEEGAPELRQVQEPAKLGNAAVSAKIAGKAANPPAQPLQPETSMNTRCSECGAPDGEKHDADCPNAGLLLDVPVEQTRRNAQTE